ncbi:MAG: hypothetical protein IKU61_06130 [Clostridia bacterium]|nr:hypothetical protein [Clostridia bacterium]
MIAGIDLGTSSVKVLLTENGKTVFKVKKSYANDSVKAWISAVTDALCECGGYLIDAISLSSQVGTYVINGEYVISWRDAVGKDELAKIKAHFSQDEFISEISMPHPDIVSYPIPRLLYIKEHYGIKKVCQPKETIVEFLTGEFVSDKYSWRGLANLESGDYSQKMLDFIGVNRNVLPKLKSPFDIAGRVSEDAEKATGIKAGTPVIVGCNDYFAGLVGMGIVKSEMAFDITGTSAHIGYTSDTLDRDTGMVSGPYFVGNVHYGVTASCGAALDFGIQNFGFDNIDIQSSLDKGAPIFLPYLSGERAPIWDSFARGMFFGISGDTKKEDLAYSVLEGVAFSEYHVYETLGIKDKPRAIVTAGGAAKDKKFNMLKASLYGVPVVTLEEKDTSAYGACMIAAVATGIYPDIIGASNDMCRIESVSEPALLPKLRERYELYKKLYETNKENFIEFSELRKEREK